jgi:osmotically-inducible protein OsmY
MIDDAKLAKRINQAIRKDDRVSAQPIEVVVSEGLVTLDGNVQSYRRKLAAQEIAASFDDCKDVINNLAVEPVGPIQDETVADNVRNALKSNADVPVQSITESVTAGKVNLSGSVENNWERLLAEDVARSARGVKEVHNYLLVDTRSAVTDQELAGEIQEAFRHTRGLRLANVKVAYSGNTVVLSGNVEKLWQKEMAETVAKRFRCWELRNEITVTGVEPPKE